jgi:hypothetical protein
MMVSSGKETEAAFVIVLKGCDSDPMLESDPVPASTQYVEPTAAAGDGINGNAEARSTNPSANLKIPRTPSDTTPPPPGAMPG